VGQTADRAIDAGAEYVVCVDDCSTDATPGIVDRLAAGQRVKALHHSVNMGKQAAVRTGLRAAVKISEVRMVAVLDADMQNDPALLPRLCVHIPPFDVVVGRRLHGGMPPIRRLSNDLADLPYRLLAGVAIRDVQSGYRVYSRPVAEYMARRLPARGGYTFEHETMRLFGELAAKRERDFLIGEVMVPCEYSGAQSGIRALDNLQLIMATIRTSAALGRLRMRSGEV
jgi:glycosyltransferase involved in cell wall biosynthesis